MKGEAKRHWTELCEQAANQQDPKKLMKLIAEITMLLEQKQSRLKTRKVIFILNFFEELRRKVAAQK